MRRRKRVQDGDREQSVWVDEEQQGAVYLAAESLRCGSSPSPARWTEEGGAGIEGED